MRLTWSSCRTRRKGSPRRRLAPLEPRQALGEPARRGQSAEIARVERRVPFGKVDQPHAWAGREPPHRIEEITDGHAPWPATRRSREFRAVDHVDVAVDH